MCDNTHGVVCGSAQGRVALFKIEYIKRTNQEDRTSLTISSRAHIDELDLSTSSSITCMKHLNTDVQSLVVIATSSGNIYG